jgi:DNA-directed RNA polymerase specialized sigma24 family protein
MPPVRQRIFAYVFLEQHSHVEAYELLLSRDGASLSFGEFLRELAATYQAATTGRGGRIVSELGGPAPAPLDQAEAVTPHDPAVLAEQQAMLAAALDTLAPEDRLAVQLYVVNGMPADQVASLLGYPNAKTVYNRVYRALEAIRARLAAAGIEAGDL